MHSRFRRRTIRFRRRCTVSDGVGARNDALPNLPVDSLATQLTSIGPPPFASLCCSSHAKPCGVPGDCTTRVQISSPSNAVVSTTFEPSILSQLLKSVQDTLRLGALSLQSTDINPSSVMAIASSYSQEDSANPTRWFSQSNKTLCPCIAFAPITPPALSVKRVCSLRWQE